VVILFGENVSLRPLFRHVPQGREPAGETAFRAAAGTPVPNNLSAPLDVNNGFAPVPGVDLMNNNPNLTNATNGTDAANPFRLSPAQGVHGRPGS